MSARQVAGILLGSDASAIELDSKAVEKGRVNQGCYLHTARVEDRTVVFFEKRTSLQREIDFCTKFASVYLEDANPVLPRIHKVYRRKSYASVFMDYVETVGREFPRSQIEAQAFARAVARISMVQNDEIPRAANAISPTLIERFAETVEESELLPKGNVKVLRKLEKCLKYATGLKSELSSRLPMIANHNDLYIPNMGMLGDVTDPSFCFIDWGKYSLNFAGSDFHHFQSETLIHGKPQDFLGSIYDLYVAMMKDRGYRFEVQDVRLAATHYSLQRTMSRVLNRPSTKWLEITLELFKATQAAARQRSKPQISIQSNFGKHQAMSTLSELRQEADQAIAAKEWNKAAQLWQAVIDERKDDVVAYARLARALRQIGDYGKAQKVLSAGEAIQPDNERLQAERGALSRKMDKSSAKAPGNVYYGNTAITYHNRRKDSTRWKAEDRAVATLLETLPEDISVIDLPFGTGRFTEFYVQRKVHITGVDISADMLSASREIYGSALADAVLEVGDATALNYPDKNFDLVVSVRFLQNIIPFGLVKRALKEMARVTRSWAILEFEIRKEGAVDAGLPAEDEPIRGLLFRDQLKEVLREAGFALKRVIPVYDNGPSDYCLVLCDVAG